jgi:hypothetical protein
MLCNSRNHHYRSFNNYHGRGNNYNVSTAHYLHHISTTYDHYDNNDNPTTIFPDRF